MTSKFEKYRWMKWLNDPVKREDHQVKGRGRDDDGYLLSLHPMATVVGEQPWIFSSNGAASLLVRDHMDWRAPSENQAAIIAGLVKREVHGRVFPLPLFKRWLGRGWKTELPCGCNGDWSKNCPACFGIGKLDKKCNDCGHGHSCDCGKCVGEGVLFCPYCVGENGFERKPGHYRGVVFDRAMLARFLAHVDGSPEATVRIMAEGKAHPVWVEAHDRSWKVAIMPLREPDSSKVPEWANP